ncbi:MAG: molybdopterin-binding protein [Dehalococcoidales bacterium]|nr:molybdopterin-binding protein [Dehalococcoidales bacterium]
MLKKVKAEDAIGMVLGHDVTKVVPGKFKGPAFRRGHIIEKEDIAALLSIGKEHVYVVELEEGEIHEEEAALRIARAISDSRIEISAPREGRVNLKAATAGLLKIDTDLLRKINSLGDIVVVTLHNNTVCHSGTVLAATKIIPLFTTEAKICEVETIGRNDGKTIKLVPIEKNRVGLVITGNEIFKGRIEDKFGDVMKGKIGALGSIINGHSIVPDDADLIAQAIIDMKRKGSEVIVVCGGLSIDPDDCTVEGVRKSGAHIVSYGAPVMPGAMFLFAVHNNTPILGAPAAVIYNPATIFDLILPRVLAGEMISREDIVELGHGGLCLNCENCSFPVCPFGK